MLLEKLDIFLMMYLDDILIFIKELGRLYIEAIYWALKQLQKHHLYINLRKYIFYEDEI